MKTILVMMILLVGCSSTGNKLTKKDICENRVNLSDEIKNDEVVKDILKSCK